MTFKFPRMLVWLVLWLVLMALALFAQTVAPGNLVAVTLYKAHLLSLGAWFGYWLDRALSPYDRPHCYLEDDEPAAIQAARAGDAQPEAKAELDLQFVASRSMASAQLRRAVIVAACLIAVCLGA